MAADGARLADRLSDPGISFLPGNAGHLAKACCWKRAGGVSRRLTMLCGGEALPRGLADRLLDKGAALWNVYGPTETTVWSSAWRVEPGESPISIGRPIANTRMYVLDKRLRAVPVGVIGELYIGGTGLGASDYPGIVLVCERRSGSSPTRSAHGRAADCTGRGTWPDGVLTGRSNAWVELITR